MKGFEIIELKQLAGDRCKIYTVRMAGDRCSVFERFINEYFGNYQVIVCHYFMEMMVR